MGRLAEFMHVKCLWAFQAYRQQEEADWTKRGPQVGVSYNRDDESPDWNTATINTPNVSWLFICQVHLNFLPQTTPSVLGRTPRYRYHYFENEETMFHRDKTKKNPFWLVKPDLITVSVKQKYQSIFEIEKKQKNNSLNSVRSLQNALKHFVHCASQSYSKITKHHI